MYIYILYLFAIFHFIVYIGTIWVNARLHANSSCNILHVEYGNKALLLLLAFHE